MTEGIKFLAWLGLMSVVQFHAFCGMLWDKPSKRFLKWHLWKGVRGYPGQREALESFQTHKITWAAKARQLGLSEMAAFYAIYVALTEPKSEIIIISKKLPDAKYFLKRRVLHKLLAAYALEMEPGKKFPWPEYTDNTDTGIIKFANGSWIEAASSDNEEVRSRSPRLVIFDEIRSYSHENAEELWSAILPAIENDPKAQAIAISTAKFGTWFNDMTKEIMPGKIPDIHFLFLPDDIHPMRTKEWRVRAKKKWIGGDTLFRREHPMEPGDMFISREGAVWPTFDPKPGGKHINEVTLNFNHTFGVAYDHGRQHPAVFLFWLHSKYDDHLYIFDEVFCRGMDLPDVCFAIREKLNFYKKYHNSPPPQVKIADSACFNKTGVQTVSDVLRNILGMAFSPSAGKNDMEGSIDLVSTRFSMAQITIDPRCEQTIKQIENLRWKNTSEESKKEKPVDIEDDAPDLIRYISIRLRGAVKQKPKVPTLEDQLNAQAERQRLNRERRDRAFMPDGQGGVSRPESWQAY
jgi:hypothetical protein